MDLLKWHKYNQELRHTNDYELTPFLVEDKDAPVVLICPGGGYYMVAAFIEGTPVARYFQKQGFNAFVLRYRIKDKAHYPHPVEDIARALKDIRDTYCLSLDNYALCGFSAGGHMCALFGTKYGYKAFDLPKPKTLMLVYPVISLEKEYTHRNTRKYFAGEEDPKALEIGNIHHHIDKDYPSTFIWRGNNDRSVKPINSDLLVAELQKNGIDYDYYQYNKVGHGVGLATGTSAEEWPINAIKFWKK